MKTKVTGTQLQQNKKQLQKMFKNINQYVVDVSIIVTQLAARSPQK